MRSLKSGLFGLTVFGGLLTAIIVGCSASGDSPETIQESTDPGPSAVLPEAGPVTPEQDSGKKDSGKEGGKTDGGFDAGPPPPTAGTPCTTANEIKTKACGKCGLASTVCLSTDGGQAWSEYSACEGESGECSAGETVTEACGNCGTQVKTCSAFCSYTIGACTGEPVDSCAPGTINYTSAGCAASTYRNRICGAACTWGGFSATCGEPDNPNKMTASATVGAVVTAPWALSPTVTGPAPDFCGPTGTSGGTALQRVAVEIKNPSALNTLTVSVYQTKTAAGAELDMLLWVYKKTLPPADDASLVSCDWGPADSCDATGAPCGNVASTLNLAGMSNITIPPNGKILVYSSGYTSSVTGPFNLNVRTDSLM